MADDATCKEASGVMTDAELANSLGVTLGCVRKWRRLGAPRYARLAVSAIRAKLEPDIVVLRPTSYDGREVGAR